MKTTTSIVFVAALTLAACSKPTETVIPSDMATWDKELAPVVQKLDGEQKELFVGYITRAKLAEVFGKDKSGIPFGTTVGQAIEEQRKWREEQAKAEAEAAAERARKEAEELALKAKLEAERTAALKELNEAVTVTLLAKREVPKNYDVGRYSEVQQFSIGVENRSDKALAGVSGEIEFLDVFDKVVGAVTFDISERIQPGATYKWSGARDYNRFVDAHRAVWNLEEGKYTTRFIPKTLVFADGSKLAMPD